MTSPRREVAFNVLVLGLVVGAAAMMAPFWPWLLVGLWFATFARRLLAPVARFLGGRRRAAALLTITLLLVVIAPIVLILVPLAFDAVGLVDNLLHAPDGRDALQALVSPGGFSEGPLLRHPAEWMRLFESHGAKVWSVLRSVAGATTRVLLGVVVFVVTAYGALVEGPGAFAWVERHSPIRPDRLRRFAAAFRETGRGLFIGIGGAGLAQTAVATAAYVALGVPRPIALGVLTLFGSVIPGIGTTIVWLPVSVGLFLTGRRVAAVVLLLVGLLAIGTIDNILRPVLARYGQLRLPGSVVIISMFGGLIVAGPWGLVLGPLLARLAKEGLILMKEAQSEETVADADGDEPMAPELPGDAEATR